MARKSRDVTLDFAFFTHLWDFYAANRGAIRRHYRELSRRFLDYNNPTHSRAFLRQPQFEALEMYVFLKEYLDNAPLHQIFDEWAARTGHFQDRSPIAQLGQQLGIFEELTKAQYNAVFSRMHSSARPYSNYIFALTMGVGKTILVATCIFYEFILANKFPADPKYCHNALVFAPDTTVLQSLREIQTFDLTRVVPPEYANWLNSNIQFHFLEEAGTALSTSDNSRFNVIISNTQKVILKRQHKEKSLADQLFESGKPTYRPGTVYDRHSDLYETEPADEVALVTNQRFQKLQRLGQLGIYVDEAHHAFGSQLARDMGLRPSTTSLRLTIDELAASLERAGTHVVACYNYTGTPYVGREVLPEVVYAFGLQAAIDKGYLKRVKINGYTNPKTTEFVKIVIDDFMAHTGGERYEGLLPKIAFFAATIDELRKELRPAVEAALRRHNIPLDRILVNTGDEKLTTGDDIREFNHLDTPGSEKQYILLVNKGREGWNCRSLFGVALFRKPKSKIFVLQATMRCLRSITDAQQTGRVYLSDENIQILEDELQQNFRVSVKELTGTAQSSQPYRVRVKEPVEKIKLTRVRREYRLQDRPFTPGVSLGLAQADTGKYHLIHTEHDGLPLDARRRVKTEDLTHLREQRRFSELTLVAEIARYLNRSCLEIETILAQTQEGAAAILEHVNRFNELLRDIVIPRLFQELYEITEHEQIEDYEVELVKAPPGGYYHVSALPDKVVYESRVRPAALAAKSFHLDPYCFDSNPERNLFWSLLKDGQVKRLYFTGMLTQGQSDFYIQYIDPESHTVRSYYPDFLVQKTDDAYVIIEVKRDDQIDEPVVQAKKEFAEQMAVASGMTYRIIKGTDADKGHSAFLLDDYIPATASLELSS